MELARSILQWFAGGEFRYHRLISCMKGDYLWIAITVVLDAAVAVGYLLIALHWRRNQRRLKHERARKALGRMKNIFIFCGICGYIFIPIKMFWPAWRLYDLFMAVLVYFTWRYALDSRDLGVVYNELNKNLELEADLKTSREEARRKSLFLNAVSHDLRTPINGFVLQTEYAEMSLEAGDLHSARRALSTAKASARATAELLNGFLELAQLDWTRSVNVVSTFGARELLEEAASVFARQAELKGLRIQVMPTDIRLHTDRVKAGRILRNLLDNAMKFTREGGVRLECEKDGTNVRISVTDTGPGVAEKDRPNLFEEFFQVHNNERDPRKGFGLGLAIAKRLSEQLGGSLAYQGEVGAGSRFTLTIPSVARELEGESDAVGSPAGACGDAQSGGGVGTLAGGAAGGLGGTATGGRVGADGGGERTGSGDGAQAAAPGRG